MKKLCTMKILNKQIIKKHIFSLLHEIRKFSFFHRPLGSRENRGLLLI